MNLTSEEIQLIEQAVENEIYNLQQVINRIPSEFHQNWQIRKRRLKKAMLKIKDENR
jgi:hypothetical protein|tara:strand:- start:1099 stop:1269 length:171 start_codon:yes stop_codon:yes gene_type:complete